MPKSSLPYVPSEYALVADRITLFYEKHPTGRIITRLISRDARGIVFRASVYRSAEERLPAATGWASERENDGNEVNAVACLENTETSAIGRALANLGFTASRKRASYEEMQKVERAKARKGLDISNQPVVIALHDLATLFVEAEAEGLPEIEADRVRAILDSAAPKLAEVEGAERRLRQWLESTGSERSSGTM